MAYFDQAATTYPKPECVYKAMDEFYRTCGGSAGRGDHKRARGAGELIAETRSLIQQLLHCQNKQVVFVPTATIALNTIIQGVINSGAHQIYISPFEHNAVTRTLYHFCSQNAIEVKLLAVTQNCEYDIARIKQQFAMNKPDFVIVSHVSNTIGLVAPIEEIFLMAKEYDAVTLADMAQSAGLVECNVGLDTIDYAVFAGHKTLLGPTGISGFVMKPHLKLKPTLYGGTGFESANQNMPDSLPERFEIGTMNTVGIAGLNAALKWILHMGVGSLRTAEHEKRQQLLRVISKYDFIRPVGIGSESNYVGIVSCVIDEISSDSAGPLFGELGIEVRTGLHCAPLAHKTLNTYPAGTIRFSVNYFTTDEDFEQLDAALMQIEDNL